MKTHTEYNNGNSIIITLIILAMLIGSGLLYYNGAKQEKEALEESLPLPPEDISFPSPPNTIVEIGVEDEMLAAPGNTSESVVMEAHPLKEFTVEAKNFEFSVKEIHVKKGDFVRINLKSVGGFHNWVIDAFNAATKQINTGDSSFVEFKADKTGTFEFYCSVGTHRQMGMVGTLIVE